MCVAPVCRILLFSPFPGVKKSCQQMNLYANKMYNYIYMGAKKAGSPRLYDSLTIS